MPVNKVLQFYRENQDLNIKAMLLILLWRLRMVIDIHNQGDCAHSYECFIEFICLLVTHLVVLGRRVFDGSSCSDIVTLTLAS